MNKAKAPSPQALADYIGKEGNWRVVSDIRVRVKIKGARFVYGRLEYLVTPIAGSGDAWVQSVKTDEEDTR